MTERFTMQRMIALAASGVAKVDLLGLRGTTLVTCDEVEALAGVAAMSGLLPPPADRLRAGEVPEFRSVRANKGEK